MQDTYFHVCAWKELPVCALSLWGHYRARRFKRLVLVPTCTNLQRLDKNDPFLNNYYPCVLFDFYASPFLIARANYRVADRINERQKKNASYIIIIIIVFPFFSRLIIVIQPAKVLKEKGE